MRLHVSSKFERMKRMHCYSAFLFLLILMCDCKDTDNNSLNEEALSNLRIHSLLL